MTPTRRTSPVAVLLGCMVVAGLLSWPAAGRSSPPVPPSSAGAIQLEPVIDAGYGISSVAPTGWTAMGNGIRARGRSPDDQTLLALQSAPMGLDDIWPTLLGQLGLSAIPEPLETRTTVAGLDWALYQVTPLPGMVADLGLAERDRVSYVVLLLAMSDEAPSLRERVFLPAVEAFAVEARPASTSNPAWTEVEVSFPGGAADVTLAGTLTIPTGPGPHPSIVLMSGSGPQDRDSAVKGIDFRMFALIADALARAGIAVLRYDDRGIARSTGDYETAVIEDLTADGAAALAYLRRRPEVDAARTGLLGHSEGVIYLAAIAAGDKELAFLVALAGPARTGLDVIVDQNVAILRADGASEAMLELTRTSTPGVYLAALGGDMALAEQAAEDYFGALYDLLDGDDQAQAGTREAYVDAQVEALVSVMDSEQFLSFLRSDPGADWARVTAPVLGVFGGKDVQVVADAEASALASVLPTGGDPRSRVVVLPEANHVFQAAETGSVAEYRMLEPAFVPELLPLVADWIREVTGLAG